MYSSLLSVAPAIVNSTLTISQSVSAFQLYPFFLIAFILILFGLVGGYAAYLTEFDLAKPEVRSFLSKKRFMVLGVVASLCVPLFLSLVKSSLIKDILENTDDARLASSLILIGLSLVSSFSSKRFIESVSNQILRRIDETEKGVKDAKQLAQKAKETATDVAKEIDSEAADDPNAPLPELPEMTQLNATFDQVDNVPTNLSEEERKILEAMLKKTYRTRTGIAEDSGIIKARISEFLDGLAERKFALPTRSPSTGGSRWIITQRGRRAIENDQKET